jgi:drug/metabolite transporter (DMT)-like permease
MAVAAAAIEDKARLGIVMMLGAWFMFSLVDTGAKWLAVAGLPAFQLAFMRYAGHFVISLGVIAKDGLSVDRFATTHVGLVLLRAFLLMSATLLNFYILRFLPLTVVSAIMFSSPVIVCFLSIYVLKERVGLWRWGAIVLGFIGVLIVVRPFDESFQLSAVFVIYNATAMALYALITRKLSGIVAVDTMQFYTGLVGTAFTLPFALWAWQSPETVWGWCVLFSLGVSAWLGHQWLTNAHRYATANTLMPYTYSFMIYVSVLGYALFGDVPDAYTLAGAAVIICSGLIIWKREQT